MLNLMHSQNLLNGPEIAVDEVLVLSHILAMTNTSLRYFALINASDMEKLDVLGRIRIKVADIVKIPTMFAWIGILPKGYAAAAKDRQNAAMVYAIDTRNPNGIAAIILVNLPAILHQSVNNRVKSFN